MKIDALKIQKYQNSKGTIVFQDYLEMANKNDYKDAVENVSEEFDICSLHSRFSRIKVSLINLKEGSNLVNEFNLSPDELKSIARKLKKFNYPVSCSSNAEQPEELKLGMGDYKLYSASEAIYKDGKDAVEKLKNMAKILGQAHNINNPKYGESNRRKISEINLAIEKFEKGEKLKSAENTIISFYSDFKYRPDLRNGNGVTNGIIITYDTTQNKTYPWTISIEQGKSAIGQNGNVIENTFKKTKETAMINLKTEDFENLILNVVDYVDKKEAIYMEKLEKELQAYRDRIFKKTNSFNELEKAIQEGISKSKELGNVFEISGMTVEIEIKTSTGRNVFILSKEGQEWRTEIK